MRVRDLKFGRVNAWPPTWRAFPGRRFAIGEEGVLLGARARSRDSVVILMLHDHEEHEGLLVWDGPPSPAALATLLNQAAGKSMREVGELDLPVSESATPSP
jgi:hypothetical protein